MADLEWGTDGVIFGYGPTEALAEAQRGIDRLTVNGVPLADVLDMAAIACDSMSGWSGVSDDVVTHEQVEWDARAAALRALAGRDSDED